MQAKRCKLAARIWKADSALRYPQVAPPPQYYLGPEETWCCVALWPPATIVCSHGYAWQQKQQRSLQASGSVTGGRLGKVQGAVSFVGARRKLESRSMHFVIDVGTYVKPSEVPAFRNVLV